MNRTVNIVLIAIVSVLALFFLSAGSVSAGTGAYGSNCNSTADCVSTMICSNSSVCECDVNMLAYNGSLCVLSCDNSTCLNGGVCESGLCNCTIDYDGPTCAEYIPTDNNSTSNSSNTDPATPTSNNSTSNSSDPTPSPSGNNSTNSSSPSNPTGNNSTSNGSNSDPSTPSGNNSTSNGSNSDPSTPTSNNSTSNGSNSDPSTPSGNNSTSNSSSPSTPTGNNSTSNGSNSDPSTPTGNNSTSNSSSPSNPTGNNSTSNGSNSDPSTPSGNNSTSNGSNTDPSTPTSNNSTSNSSSPSNPTGNNSTSNGSNTDPSTPSGNNSTSNGSNTDPSNPTGNNSTSNGSNSDPSTPTSNNSTSNGSNSDPSTPSGNNSTSNGSNTDPSTPTSNNSTSNNTNNNPSTDKCSGIVCAHGTCSEGVCNCTTGWTGTLCDTQVQTDLCAGITCSGHGSCSQGVCACTGGYTGKNCETAPSYKIEPACVKVMSASATPFCSAVGVDVPLYNLGLVQSATSADDYNMQLAQALAALNDTASETYKMGSLYNPNCTSTECLLHVKRYACYKTFASCLSLTEPTAPWCRAGCEKLYDDASKVGIMSFSKNDSCLAFPTTGCSNGLYVPSTVTCSGKSVSDVAVCSGKGSCVGQDQCQCNTGYTGSTCQLSVCFTISSSESTVCSSQGSCVGPDTCVCKTGFTGAQCSLPTCNGKSEAEGGCSFRGTCGASDKCTCKGNFDSASYCSKCKTGYTGSNCDVPICFNTPATDSSVCSGKGVCSAPDTCSCSSGYSGKTCTSFSCWGIDKSNNTVCGGSSKGKCVGPNKCECVSNWNNLENTCTSCSPSFTGETCTTPTCSADVTCNSHGTCDSNFKCVCSGNFDGEFCKVCKTGYVGANCDIQCSASTTCNGNGACTATGDCTCSGNYDAAQKCAAGKCINGFKGNACSYKVDATSFGFNQNGDRIVGTVYNTLKKSVDCSQVIASVATLGAGAQCNMDGVSKLEIVLGAGASVKPNDILKLYSLFGDSSATVDVTILTGSFVGVAPTAYLTSDKSVVSKCDTVTLNAFDSVSTDRRALNFAWTCTAGPSADAQSALDTTVKSQTSSGLRVSLETLAAGTYTVQVTVTSSFSGLSSQKTISFTVTANAAPTLTVKEGSVVEYLIGTTGLITPVISFPTCYTGNGTVAYTYTFLATSVALPTVSTTDNMVVLGKTSTDLSTVGDYNLVITAAANGAEQVSTTVKIKAVAKPLTVSFSVKDMTQSKDDSIVFNIIANDPSATTGNIVLSTVCVDADGNTCEGPGSAATYTKSSPSAGKYTYTTTATKDSRTVVAKLTITVVDTSKDKIVRVSITSNVNLQTVDPTKDLYLTYTTLDALSAPVFAWTSESGDSSSSSVLIVSKNNMVAGATYSVSLTVTDGVKSGSAVATFTVNAPPTKGIFEAYPLSGAALSDSFDLKCGNGWSDPQTPLKFQFLYLDSASSQWIALTEKTEQQSAKVQLPTPTSGDVLKVKAVVVDALGAATESEQVSITITKPTTAAATSALESLATNKGTVTLSAASSAMAVIGSVNTTTVTQEQKQKISAAADAITDAFLQQQTKTEAVTQVSAATAENSLSFTASLASSVANGLVSDSTTSKVVSNLASTTTKVASSSSVSLSDSVVDGTKSTADKFYGHISKTVSARSLRTFSKVDLDNLNSVYTSIASLKTKDVVPDAPAATVTTNGLVTITRKVNLATLNSLSQVVSGKNKINFKSTISTHSALSSLGSVSYAVKSTASSITNAASKSIDFSLANGVSPLTVSGDVAIADLVFDISAKRSIAATTYTCNKITNGVAAADSTCTVVVGTDGTVTATVKSTGSYILTSTTVTPATTKSTKVNAAPSMSFSALVIALIVAIVAAL